jgi:hypothetical protein
MFVDTAGRGITEAVDRNSKRDAIRVRAAGQFLAPRSAGGDMRYFVAWLLGVPLSVIAIWYIVGHSACG